LDDNVPHANPLGQLPRFFQLALGQRRTRSGDDHRAVTQRQPRCLGDNRTIHAARKRHRTAAEFQQ
jgi:hypothetical protein